MSDGSDSPDQKDKPEGYIFGRPTLYRAEYCEKAIAFGKLGKSRAWIAAEFGVSKPSIQRWEAAHPDFRAAMEIAKTFEQQWWEDAGQNGMFADKFSAPIWSRSMAARFSDDWREKSEVDMNSKVQITEVKRTIVDSRDPDA